MIKIISNLDNDNTSLDTPLIEYSPNQIDQYVVVVKLPEDWEEIHNYIINENEIDGIPNRKIECSNIQEFSLKTAIYLMSAAEAEILKTHPKIENVVLNPEIYPQPQSTQTPRYKKEVAFNKPLATAGILASTQYQNGVRSNWSHLFVTDPTSKPFRGVGIASTATVRVDVEYSLTGKNVDAVIIDSGVSFLHPEFMKGDGTYRVKDVILDGPFKVDPDYFTSRSLTYTKIVDGVNLGVGIATTAAQSWWTDSSKRSSAFQSLGTVSIPSLYNLQHVATKTSNVNSNQLIDGHGTACASQIGGKSFGLAFECNLWNIRIALGGAGGYLDGSVALNACAIWHQAKKISQNGNPDPTITNNSYGYVSSTGNTNGVTYTHGYRGSTLTYVGSGNDLFPPTNSGACRNHKYFSYNFNGSGTSYSSYSGSGEYNPVSTGSVVNSAAENAIAAGCIVVAAAMNMNQKFSDSTDIDYNNWYSTSTNYINRVGGVQKGFSGEDTKGKGTIRVGALDCGVQPANIRDGTNSFAVRRVSYSNSGPMIDIWSPAEYTMSAGYTSSYEVYLRQDNSSFYDAWFNGTSSGCPNTCSVIALFLESNRKATQSDVRDWLERHGSVEIDLADPYPNPTDVGYWSQTYNATTDTCDLIGDSRGLRGNVNLRGAPKRVLKNPFANNRLPSIENVIVSGISFVQS